MDAAELLALSIQEHEASLQQQQQLLALLHNGLATAQSAEDPAAISAALAVMPLQQLRCEARDLVQLNLQLSDSPGSVDPAEDDLLVQGLLRWFKSWFAWVDAPSCGTCGAGTQPAGHVQPTPEEAAAKASRVEAYRCTAGCQAVTRFPRYTSVTKLLQTRRGRCGEWAQTLLLLLRAAGLDARHVNDAADHVWCEYYSTALNRWVHCDGCEGAWDTPLLYEQGWGKAIGYVFAASKWGVTDVSRRYVLRPGELQSRRRLVSEAWLAAALQRLSSPLRSQLDSHTRQAVGLRDAAEVLQLMALDGQQQAVQHLSARTTGSEAWRSARGEMGAAGSGQQQAALAASSATHWSLAPDGSLPSLFKAAGRITGGACRASGHNTGGDQVAARLFNGRLASKWLDFGGGAGGSAWVEYRLLVGRPALVLTHYDLLAAEDAEERDPCDWLLECKPAVDAPSGSGSSNSSDGWQVLDARVNQRFGRRHQLRSFALAATAQVASRHWRLTISKTANPGVANSVQLAGWHMYACQQQQQPLEAEQLPPPAAGCRQLARVEAELRRAAAGGLDQGAATLRRVLANMQQHPGERKFWQLSSSAAALQPVLQNSLLQEALFAAGFRPVITAGGDSDQPAEVRLLADDSAEAASHAAAAALLAALEHPAKSGE